MKISKNITIYAGMELQLASREKEKQENVRTGAVFAGNLSQNLSVDKVAQRKEQAQKQAMKVVADVWESEKAIDEDMTARRERIGELRKERREAQDSLDEVNGRLEKLAKEGVSTDSEEWQTLEKEKEGYLENYNEASKNIRVEVATISATKLERLKRDPMVGAQKQADTIMEQASEEIVGMLVEDAKEHLDEEQELREEQAEKIEEERKEQEAFIEAQKEKRQESEELIEQMPMEEMLDLEHVKQDVQKEVQSIMNKLKLVAEDIKGAVVDENV